jgi:internalin A
MTRDEAMRRIDRAAQENWTKLNLSGLDLEEVPPEIGKCTQLETFVFMEFQFMPFQEKGKERGKRLTKFPDAVLQLTNLKILNLHGNEITSIPEAIGQLSNLTQLELGLNQITSIPETISSGGDNEAKVVAL